MRKKTHLHSCTTRPRCTIISSYNDRIRPLLDAVDKSPSPYDYKRRHSAPTIVVVGDQSQASLVSLNHLPVSTFLVVREFVLEHVSEAINLATDEIAGLGKGISNTPLTLEVRKNGVPDLTMVDLPGITRVPVHGQPDNIYDQIREIIMEYITPEESIILNVLSTVDFTTCESIRMSQMVDKTGERTLAVVTKSDKAPEGFLRRLLLMM
ncbi:dynamin-related protein 4C-like [Fagus crenata]